MPEVTYSIKVGNTIVAKHVSLNYACIFLKAIMSEFYNDQDIGVEIVREPDDRVQPEDPASEF